jgi:hypothetical protein
MGLKLLIQSDLICKTCSNDFDYVEASKEKKNFNLNTAMISILNHTGSSIEHLKTAGETLFIGFVLISVVAFDSLLSLFVIKVCFIDDRQINDFN